MTDWTVSEIYIARVTTPYTDTDLLCFIAYSFLSNKIRCGRNPNTKLSAFHHFSSFFIHKIWLKFILNKQ